MVVREIPSFSPTRKPCEDNMLTSIIADEKVYFIAGDGVDALHYGECVAGQEITTGQPNLATFTSREIWKAELLERGIDPDAESEE